MTPPPNAWVCLLAVALFALLAAAVPAQAAPFVYVTDYDNPGSISQYAIGTGGRLSPLSPATVGPIAAPHYVAATPNGESAYVTGDGGLLQYDIDPMTGALSPKTPATADAQDPWDVTVSPDGESAYTTNLQGAPDNSGTISQYTIDPLTGALSPKTPANVAAGGPFSFPFDVAVTPDSKSAYVATFNAGVLQYDIDPVTGALSPKSPPSVAAGNTPEGVVVNPDGKSAYVVNINSNTISQYTIDPGTGALSPKSPATVPTGTHPTNGIGVTPDGRSGYVYNAGGGVSQYDIDPITGALSPKSPVAVAAPPGSTESGLAVAPDGKSAYVPNNSVVLQYDIDPRTGALSPKTPASVPAGGSSTGIAIASLPGVPNEPTDKAQCKDGGWKQFGFENQGRCIAFVNHRG